MATQSWFDTDYYLASKATLLNEQSYEGRSDWSASEVSGIFTECGLNAYEHYLQYGASEGLNPNAYFDQNYYLQEKVQQLNAAQYEGRTDWSASEVLELFSAAGLTAYQHFSRYGAAEGLDPCASFSTQNYLEHKANALNTQGHGSQWTGSSVLCALENAGLDPVSHFMLYGKSEAVSPASGNAYAITASYAPYEVAGANPEFNQLRLNGIVGSTVTATLTTSNTATVNCALPSGITSDGINSNVYAIDASGVAGAGVMLRGNGSPNFLTGTAYDDTIEGGQGIDLLTGNAGADAFVFHFGNSTQPSDSCNALSGDQYISIGSVPDVIADLQYGTDKISVLTSDDAAFSPTAVYYGGDVKAVVDISTSTATLTNNDGVSISYDISSTDQALSFFTNLSSSAITDKNGLLDGTESLGANEAMVWNLDITYNLASGEVQEEKSLMVAVNDSTNTFDCRDILIQCSDATLSDSYDAATGLITDCSLFA